MRKVIAYENALGVSDHFLMDGALIFPEADRVPLVWQFGDNISDLLGYATDFEREEDGCVTAEIFFNNSAKSRDAQALMEEDLSTTFSGSSVTSSRNDGVWVIESVKINTIAVVISATVPW